MIDDDIGLQLCSVIRLLISVFWAISVEKEVFIQNHFYQYEDLNFDSNKFNLYPAKLIYSNF